MSTETQLQRESGTTLWHQIAQSLEEEITTRRIQGRLPSEAELAIRFGVNRHTVRQATKSLAERGIVSVMHGRGTFVREGLLDYQVGRSIRFAHSVAKARRVGQSKVQWAGPVTPPNEVLQALGLPADGKALRIDSWDVVDKDDRIVGIAIQYFPLPRFAGFDEAYRETGKTHVALARYGIAKFERRFSRVSARMPDRDIARQLQQAPTLPVLYVETLYVDEQDRPIEYSITHFNGSVIQVVVEPEDSPT